MLDESVGGDAVVPGNLSRWVVGVAERNGSLSDGTVRTIRQRPSTTIVDIQNVPFLPPEPVRSSVLSHQPSHHSRVDAVLLTPIS